MVTVEDNNEMDDVPNGATVILLTRSNFPGRPGVGSRMPASNLATC